MSYAYPADDYAYSTFQSPGGDCLDCEFYQLMMIGGNVDSFSPLAGIVWIVRKPVEAVLSAGGCSFQSPGGDCLDCESFK